MGLLTQLRDAEERSRAVRALHAAMVRAANDPSPATHGVLFPLLAETRLWTFTVGQPVDTERLSAQAELSGHATMRFRAGRTDNGEAFIPVATTRRRLIASGYGSPGDGMIHATLFFLANAIRYGGAEALVINPGSVPLGHLAGPALLAFADGALPDPEAPEGKVQLQPDQLGPMDVLDVESLPPGLLDAAILACRIEARLDAASLVARKLGVARTFVILVAADKSVDQAAMTERLAGPLVRLIGREDYFGVEYVRREDPRLTDPVRSVPLTTR